MNQRNSPSRELQPDNGNSASLFGYSSSSPQGISLQRMGLGLEFYDCIRNNDLTRLEILVDQHKIDVDAKFTEVRRNNHLDLSPIHLVAYKGYTEMLQFLLDMKCDIHQTTATLCRTAFHIAVLRHQLDCFQKLLAFGANADPRDTFGNTPCHYAAEDGAVDLLDILLCQRTVDPNAQDITGKTPLMKATRNMKIEAVQHLLNAGCLLNIRDKNSDTSLHFAARHGSARLLTVLIEAGSEVNMQNQRGHTALMEAICYNNEDASASLLQTGYDVNLCENKGGDTALHMSVRKNYLVITEQLLSTGRVKHVYNYQGELAIMDAVVKQKMCTIRLFLQYNYDLDVPCKLDYDGSGGKLAIRIALDRDNYDLLRLLAQVGYVFSFVTSAAGAINRGGGDLNISSSEGSEKDAAHRLLTDEVCQVRTLKAMCRRKIRKHMGFGIECKVNSLPLPHCMKDYVLLKDLLTFEVA